MKTETLEKIIKEHASKGINQHYHEKCLLEAAQAAQELQALLNEIERLKKYIDKLLKGEVE